MDLKFCKLVTIKPVLLNGKKQYQDRLMWCILDMVILIILLRENKFKLWRVINYTAGTYLFHSLITDLVFCYLCRTITTPPCLVQSPLQATSFMRHTSINFITHNNVAIQPPWRNPNHKNHRNHKFHHCTMIIPPWNPKGRKTQIAKSLKSEPGNEKKKEKKIKS